MSEQQNATRSLRINKAMSRAGLCSRRQADEWIQAGLVSVNGITIGEPGIRVCEGDCISAKGKEARVTLEAPDDHVYLALHKPVQVVSTVSDPQGRETVIALLPEKYAGKHIYPVGRLDYFSEGLLIMTDDGELTQRLTHPRYHLHKYYELLVREEVSEAQLAAMRAGMRLAEGERLAPVAARKLDSGTRGTFLSLRLGQGINRQIRRMCRDLGLTVLRLRRIRQGSLELGDLKAGECRELTTAEVNALKKAVGL